MLAPPTATARTCFHCGEPNPPSSRWRATVDGAERCFCCAGCLGVAQTIRAAGLDRFYGRRDAGGRGPVEARNDVTLATIADSAEAGGLVTHVDGDTRETSLLVDGIHCGACVWLIESYLAREPGILQVAVNLATHRARIRWDARRAALARLLGAFSAIGYRAHPYDPVRREVQVRAEWRALLARSALALLAMMQVMMLALPAYTSVDGVDPEYRALLDWASLVLTLPVVLYCATPFFLGAWRSVRVRQPGMDVPVAIGVVAAFAASAWSTLGGGGPVYYDSVTMFVALLLVARLAELRARRRAGDAIEAIARDLPPTADRLLDRHEGTRTETVAAHRLAPGDRIRVAAGAAIAADGTIVEGRSSVEESMLTGESWPHAKIVGDRVLAGSINRESPLVVRVDAAGEATAAAALVRMVETAANARPRVAQVADRVARRFVAALLAIAAVTGLAWLYIDPARALTVTVAVLVVSCPCALSLATPAALAAAAGALGRRRIFAVRSDAWEALARVTHVVFDKTGTLTRGKLSLAGVEPLARDHSARCIAVATALEVGSAHPIAQALQRPGAPAAIARDVVAVPGNGVEGVVEGKRYRFGRPEWVGALQRNGTPPPAGIAAPDAIAVVLGNESGWLAWFTFADTLRPGVRELVAKLRAMRIAVSLVSGDRTQTVEHVARAVGIANYRGDAKPEDKIADIAALQGRGAVVAMVGDGINDAPGLAHADVSLSFGSASTLTQWTADVILADDEPLRVSEAISRARRTLRVIRQNLAWAFGYNVVAIPLAATGHLTPLAAALGMSISSMLVVANAMRLARVRSVGAVSRVAAQGVTRCASIESSAA
ncbi:MAG TPA: heavy metal translocating P-type ATPase [Casimicrobiaceae bacterium]|nr:heavy metal translocating P-type ATPase [Casimicrobiaceae bacterium]